MTKAEFDEAIDLIPEDWTKQDIADLFKDNPAIPREFFNSDDV